MTSTRVAGGTRTETATTIANTAAYGFAKTSVYVVNGFRPVDALPAAVAAAKANAPIILTEDGQLGADAQSYLDANKATLTGGVAVGGTVVIPAAVETAAEVAAGQQASNQAFAVAPTDAVTQTVFTESGAANTTDDRTYTVTGLTAGTTYRITLVNSASIQRNADGTVPFLTSAEQDSAGRNLVAAGADIADIISVNNATPTFAGGDTESRTTTVVPVNGSITFTVDATAPGTVVPVVYINGASGGTATTGGVNPRLETTATTAGVFAPASETFGLGGATTYTAPLATGGAVTGSTVVSVDKAANSFNTTLTGVLALHVRRERHLHRGQRLRGPGRLRAASLG